MKHFIFFLACLLIYTSAEAQYISSITVPDNSIPVVTDSTDLAYRFASTISAKDLKGHLSVLASDEYEGRETGEKGNERAASYLATQFKAMGLPAIGVENTYFQGVSFHKTKWEKNSLTVNDTEYRHLWDYLSFATLNEHLPYYTPEEIVFLGYGIKDSNYSDYKGKNLKGKAIMINEGEPFDKKGKSRITGTTTRSDWSTDIYKKLKVAKEHDVKFVFIISNEIQKFLGENRKYLVSPSLELGDGQHRTDFANHTYISSKIAKNIIGKKSRKIKRWRRRNLKKGKSKAINLKPKVEFTLAKDIDVLAGNNVLGYIEGTDKKEELVIVSAHYDHLGKRGKDVYNGADDNGSGTSTVLEIAEAMTLAKQAGNGPRRSVLCLLVTGEEKGLLGSQYYSESPVFPLASTVANVNIDMVGRVDKKYKDNPNYIYVIGSDRLSSDLHRINEQINQKYTQLTLDYQYNDESDPNRYYFRSDHYNFARKGIPAIFFFNGTHEDYHMITDTEEKINYQKMEKVAKHCFHTVWELANRDKKIIVDGEIK